MIKKNPHRYDDVHEFMELLSKLWGNLSKLEDRFGHYSPFLYFQKAFDSRLVEAMQHVRRGRCISADIYHFLYMLRYTAGALGPGGREPDPELTKEAQKVLLHVLEMEKELKELGLLKRHPVRRGHSGGESAG